MVSFFGIKFGDKKKKSEGKTAQAKQAHEWKRIDQNALGEGQFFGNNVTNTTVVNGSIRSVSRANTAMSMRSPYAHDTHNLAASSMFDLSHPNHSRNGSHSTVKSSNLRPHASEAGLRTKFGATNGSSLSLAVPGPGFGSRPTTPGGKGKQWVNPLDVHFVRSSPTVAPAPKSPLAQIEPQSSAAPEKDGDNDSVFGKDADEMVDAIMASAKKKEEEEKEKAVEMEKQKETALLEMERLERQKSTETKLPQAAKPQNPPEQQQQNQQQQQQQHQRLNNAQQRPTNGPSGLGPGPGPGPVFRGNVDQRPGSRGGVRPNESTGPNGLTGPPRHFPSHHNAAAAHQGPPQHAPPTQSLPHPPLNGGSRNYKQGGPNQDPGARNPRADASGPNGSATIGPAPRPLGPATPQNGRSYSPAPSSPGFRGQIPNEYRSQSPANGGPGPGGVRPRGPGGGPILQVSSSLNGTRTRPGNGPEPLLLRRAETAPVGESVDNGPIEQFARPIIQNVAAKRDTLKMMTPRRHSLSMRIEELEKTLLRAQVEGQEVDANKRVSSGSSNYSASIVSAVSSMSDDDEPILPTSAHPTTSIQPAPLRTVALSPTPATSTPSPTEGNRWQPNAAPRGPLLRGPPPRRPTLDEYGAIPVRKASNPGLSQASIRSASGASSNPRPSLAGSEENVTVLQKATSRSNTPQLRHANWVRDESPVVVPAAAPIIPLAGGFMFDFENPKNAAPLTPDSISWPLASSPVQEEEEETPPSATTLLNRANAPPPLSFNFSPDAYSREQGPWTPPLRSSSKGVVGPEEQERPSTAGGFSSLAPAPSFGRSRTPVEGVDTGGGVGAGIGLARGLSIRDPTAKWDHGGPTTRPPPLKTVLEPVGGEKGMVDSFGTGFI